MRGGVDRRGCVEEKAVTESLSSAQRRKSLFLMAEKCVACVQDPRRRMAGCLGRKDLRESAPPIRFEVPCGALAVPFRGKREQPRALNRMLAWLGTICERTHHCLPFRARG